MRMIHSACRFTFKNYYFRLVSSLWAEIRHLVTAFGLRYIFKLINETTGTLLIISWHGLSFFFFFFFFFGKR